MNIYETIAEKIENEMEVLERKKGRLYALAATCNEIPENLDLSIVTGISVYDWGLGIYCLVPAFTSEGCPELCELLSAISDLLPEEKELQSFDSPDEGLRHYHSGPFWISANLAESGLCQRVVTGTKTIKRVQYIEEKVPTYEFKC